MNIINKLNKSIGKSNSTFRKANNCIENLINPNKTIIIKDKY